MLVWSCPLCGKVNAHRIDMKPIDFGRPNLDVLYVRRVQSKCLGCGNSLANFRITLTIREVGTGGR